MHSRIKRPFAQPFARLRASELLAPERHQLPAQQAERVPHVSGHPGRSSSFDRMCDRSRNRKTLPFLGRQNPGNGWWGGDGCASVGDDEIRKDANGRSGGHGSPRAGLGAQGLSTRDSSDAAVLCKSRAGFSASICRKRRTLARNSASALRLAMLKGWMAMCLLRLFDPSASRRYGIDLPASRYVNPS
jgi:hypothetical protein